MKSYASIWSCIAMGALILAGCSHKTESPPDKASTDTGATAPDLVCAEQLTTSVALQGSGFTPMPSKTLAGGSQLILPSIVMSLKSNLDGSPADGTFAIPDSAADPSNSRVRWLSSEKMSYDVFPDLSLTPGLYDITVTNPDHQKNTTFAAALAAVPRPTVTTVAPDILCDVEHDETVTVTGSGLLSVGGMLPTVHIGDKDFQADSVADCADVPGTHAAGSVKTCGSATFKIPKKTFEPGRYDLTLTNPATAACVSTDKISLTVVPPPALVSVAPDLTCDAQGDQSMVVKGSGFLKVGHVLPTVTLGDQTYDASALDDCTEITTGPFAEGKVSTCGTLSFTIKKGSLPAGDYKAVVTNPMPADCESLEKNVIVHVAPPPTVTAVQADLLCDAQSAQSMTITGTGLLKIGKLLPSVQLGTQALTPTAADGCQDVAGDFVEGSVQACTSLTFSLPSGALAPGDYPVTVTNPDPAGCVSEEVISVHVAAPPTITGLDKVAICDAEANQVVTIAGTDFLQIGATVPSVIIGALPLVPAAGGCTPLDGTFAEGAVQVCTLLTVTIPMGSMAAGDYPVLVTNPPTADCASTQPLVLHVEAPPIVASVAPATVCTGGRQIQIAGSGFLPTPAVSLQAAGKSTILASASSVNADGTQITSQIGAGAEIGTTYDVVVTNPDTCADLAPHKTVTVVAGPLVYFADPEVVYSGINTAVTVYATGLTLPVGDVSLVPAGKLSPATALTWTSVAGHANRGQVLIPKGLAAGTYDLLLTDSTTCTTVLPNALTVTGSLTVSLKSITPPFGWTQSETAVTIKRDTAAASPANKPFVATPRAFLNPTSATATDVAIALQAVEFVNADTLTAVVPKNQPVHAYDLIVVNADGSVGLLANAFNVETLVPPTISAVTPSSMVNAPGQTLVVTGKNFRASTLALACQDAAGAPEAAPGAAGVVAGAVTCDGQQNCSQPATVNATGLGVGSTCVLRLTDSDQSYAEFSAVGVTGSSLNLTNPKAGPDMVVGRRALSAAAADATTAARFVYAIGGDGGKAVENAPFSSVEFAPVDVFGNVGPFALARNALDAGRSFAGSAKMGRYIYVMGGSNGTTAVASARRAMILNPREVPALDVDDIVPAVNGLDAGYWFYRVATTFDSTDTDNPLGESLASDEFIVKVPVFPGKKIQVVLKWTAPVDSQGVALPNVAGYRVYRTAAVNGASGQEVLLTTTSAATLSFTDDATLTPGEFEEFLGAQADLSPKAWPRYVWIAEDLPATATNKILKRELVARGTTPPGGVLWTRDGTRFQPHGERAVSGTDR